MRQTPLEQLIFIHILLLSIINQLHFMRYVLRMYSCNIFSVWVLRPRCRGYTKPSTMHNHKRDKKRGISTELHHHHPLTLILLHRIQPCHTKCNLVLVESKVNCIEILLQDGGSA